MDTAPLAALGWDAFFEAAWHERAAELAGCSPARVVTDFAAAFDVMTGMQTQRAALAGRLRLAIERGESPAPVVGDFVALEPTDQGSTSIRAVLPRKSALVRRAAGPRPVTQILAANVDLAFVVAGLDVELRARRIERFVVLAREGGAEATVLLNKADTAGDAATALAQLAQTLPEVPALAVSARTGAGFDAVAALIGPGRTAVLLGPSGVGKSSIVNRLLSTDYLATGGLRGDGKGRHTTTRRELVMLPGGGLIIDTPGIREIGVTDDLDENLAAGFEDVGRLAEGCRFRDCRHDKEPGCAVRAAVASGQLPPERQAAFVRLSQEVVASAAVHGPAGSAAARARRAAAKRGAKALAARLAEKRK